MLENEATYLNRIPRLRIIIYSDVASDEEQKAVETCFRGCPSLDRVYFLTMELPERLYHQWNRQVVNVGTVGVKELVKAYGKVFNF